jgi:hypothetical protein
MSFMLLAWKPRRTKHSVAASRIAWRRASFRDGFRARMIAERPFVE